MIYLRFIKGKAIKKFKKVHIEVTNICNLSCSFCPEKTQPSQSMSQDFFRQLNQEVKEVTNELAYHVVGDPLVLSNLEEYLDISYEADLKVNLTTTANNLNLSMFDALMHPTLKQVNFSINSYNANSHKRSLENYLEPIFTYIQHAVKVHQNHFINLRIWNLDEDKSARAFNQEVFDYAKSFFSLEMSLDEVYEKRPKNIRIASKIFFNFDDYFEWPSLDNKFISTKGFCYGLDSHFAILASGKVAPCCLDKDAIIDLGNLHVESLKSVLNSNRVKAIQKGFKEKRVIEELCQHCSYRTRFD